MGWTGTVASHYRNGRVDVKAELDEQFTWAKWRVIKSSIVGSTYYAALEEVDALERNVVAVVVLTSTRKADGCNFFYKDICETSGPSEAKCPLSILKLLSPTDSEWANTWREQCLEYHEKKKMTKADPNSLKNLPVGSKIRVVVNFSTTSGLKPGDSVILTKKGRQVYRKVKGNYILKEKTFWSNGIYRWSEKMIPEGYQVV